MVDTAKITRYKRVKQILDHAAAGSSTDYDGQGQFWNKPLSQLLELELLESGSLRLPRRPLLHVVTVWPPTRRRKAAVPDRV